MNTNPLMDHLRRYMRDPGTASRYCWTATQTHTRTFPGTAVAVVIDEPVVLCPRPDVEE